MGRRRSTRPPAIGDLQRAGHLDLDGRRVTLAEVSVTRPGQRFAFVMDTRLCDGVYALAEGADLLVIEATFLRGAGSPPSSATSRRRRPRGSRRSRGYGGWC